MAEAPKKTVWAEIDAWKNTQMSLFFGRRLALLPLGWWLVAAEDGLVGARRMREGDPEHGPEDPTPELTARTFEILVASVKVLNERGVARA